MTIIKNIVCIILYIIISLLISCNVSKNNENKEIINKLIENEIPNHFTDFEFHIELPPRMPSNLILIKYRLEVWQEVEDYLVFGRKTNKSNICSIHYHEMDIRNIRLLYGYLSFNETGKQYELSLVSKIKLHPTIQTPSCLVISF